MKIVTPGAWLHDSASSVDFVNIMDLNGAYVEALLKRRRNAHRPAGISREHDFGWAKSMRAERERVSTLAGLSRMNDLRGSQRSEGHRAPRGAPAFPAHPHLCASSLSQLPTGSAPLHLPLLQRRYSPPSAPQHPPSLLAPAPNSMNLRGCCMQIGSERPLEQNEGSSFCPPCP